MKKKDHSEEQIVAILREADSGRSVEDVCVDHNISKASFHRWKSKYGQMELRDVKRLKELERENAELKKIVADQLLNIKVLEHVNAKNGKPGAQARCGAVRCGARGSRGGRVLASASLPLPAPALVELLLPG